MVIDNEKIYCLYLITNLVNGKIYIGKTGNLKERWYDHKKVAIGGIEKYPEDFYAIHAAMAKYGTHNFSIEIIDSCYYSEDEVYLAETTMIQLSGSNQKKIGYNCNMGGKGGMKPSEATIDKLILAQNKPEKKAKMSKLMKQRHEQEPGFLAKINMGNQYTKGTSLSDDHKRKISDALIANKINVGEKNGSAKLKSLTVLEIREKFATNRYSLAALAREYKVSNAVIGKIIHRKSWKHI